MKDLAPALAQELGVALETRLALCTRFTHLMHAGRAGLASGNHDLLAPISEAVDDLLAELRHLHPSLGAIDQRLLGHDGPATRRLRVLRDSADGAGRQALTDAAGLRDLLEAGREGVVRALGAAAREAEPTYPAGTSAVRQSAMLDIRG